MPAMVNVENDCGKFGGYERALSNGGHLGTFVIDGAFAGAWVHRLKWTAQFRMDQMAWDAASSDAHWGIITYGDCADGRSFGFSVGKDNGQTLLYADIELMLDNPPPRPASPLSLYTLKCPVSV